MIVQNYAYLSDRDVIFLAKNGDADLEDNVHPLTLLVDNQGSTARLSDHLGEVSGKNTTPYELDHLGSVINSLAADFASNPLSGYGAFGESSHAAIDETTPAVVYGFAGGEYDFESGRYYLRARNYDPQSARFLTKDPIGPEMGGDTNPYRYVRNNPVNATDPLGLDMRFNDHTSEYQFYEMRNNPALSGAQRQMIDNLERSTTTTTLFQGTQSFRQNLDVNIPSLRGTPLYGATYQSNVGQTEVGLMTVGGANYRQSVVLHELTHANQIINGVDHSSEASEYQAITQQNQFLNSCH